MPTARENSKSVTWTCAVYGITRHWLWHFKTKKLNKKNIDKSIKSRPPSKRSFKSTVKHRFFDEESMPICPWIAGAISLSPSSSQMRHCYVQSNDILSESESKRRDRRRGKKHQTTRPFQFKERTSHTLIEHQENRNVINAIFTCINFLDWTKMTNQKKREFCWRFLFN